MGLFCKGEYYTINETLRNSCDADCVDKLLILIPRIKVCQQTLFDRIN